MGSSSDHPPHVYLPINNYPEYKSFPYSFDFVTILVIVTLILFIPSCVFTYKMVMFYIYGDVLNSPSGLHPHVFKAFLLMQCWNVVYTILDFLLVRIPTTTVATSFCASLKPGNFMPFFVAGLYFSYYASQLFTVLFCFLRLIILYSPRNYAQVSGPISFLGVQAGMSKLYQLCSLLFVIWPPATYVLSSVFSFPHTVSDIVCLQVDVPFQTGAITISSTFVFGNDSLSLGHLIFSTSVILAVVTSTIMMLVKMRKRKILSTTSRPFHRTKAEVTLTVTMFLILIPLIFTQSLSIAGMTYSPYYSYILVTRPLLIDCRVNIVSCYFYLTHPVFKKGTISTAVTVMSFNSTTG